MKAAVAPFNQKKALAGAFSVIVNLHVIFGNLRFKLYLGYFMAATLLQRIFSSPSVVSCQMSARSDDWGVLLSFTRHVSNV